MVPFIYPIPGGGGGGVSLETRFGSGVPGGGLGINGDVYFDVTAKNIYKKIAGAWVLQDSYLDTSVLFGAGVPGVGLGVNGDTYFDTTAKTIYKKTAGVWALQTSYGGTGLIVRDEGTLIDSAVTEIDVTGVDISVIGVTPGKVQLNSPPPPPPAYGYWSGGSNGISGLNTTDRLAFNTDTAAMIARGVLTSAVTNTANNSSTKGYFSLGEVNGDSIAALLFASDTSAMTNVCNMPSVGFTRSCGTANSALKGYWAGFQAGGGGVGSVDNYALLFSSDTSTPTAKGSLTTARERMSAANSSTYGYFAGGWSNPTAYNLCDRLQFASDTVAMTAGGVLTAVRVHLTGANSTTYGYFAGGSTTATGSAVTGSNKLNFASDTVAMVSAGALSVPRMRYSATNSTLKAYFAGGVSANSGSPTYYSSCDALVFATDTVAMTTVCALTDSRLEAGACQSGGIL